MKFFKSLKNSFHDYIEINTQQSRAIIKIEKFFSRTSVLSYSTFNDYRQQNQANRRIWPCLFARLAMAIYWLKFFIPVVFNTGLAKWMTCEFGYIMGNPLLISTMLCYCMFWGVAFASHLLYKESNQTLYFLVFMDEIKNNSSNLKLNLRNQRKFCLKINLLFDYIIKIVFPLLVIFVSFVFITSLTIAYMDPNTGYSLILTIFWSVISILWTYYGYSLTLWLFATWYPTTLYFKYKFNEINESFINSHKNRNKNAFLKDIKYHNQIAIELNLLSKYFNLIIFFLYYIGTLGAQMICYISHEESTKHMFRFVAAFLSVVLISMMFGMNLLSANVIHSAHKPYRLLYDFLLKSKLSLREMFEVQTFIEQLSSSKIGFYCLNMFPMNNYHFFKYVIVCVSNYILIMNIF